MNSTGATWPPQPADPAPPPQPADPAPGSRWIAPEIVGRPLRSDAGLIDDAIPRHALLRRSLAYQWELKRLAVGSALAVTPLLLWIARAYNGVAADLPAGAAELQRPESVLADSSAEARAALGACLSVALGLFGGLATYAWLVELFRSLHCAGVRVSRGQAAWLGGSMVLFVLCFGAAPVALDGALYTLLSSNATTVIAVATLVRVFREVTDTLGMPRSLWKSFMLLFSSGGLLIYVGTWTLPRVFWGASEGERLLIRLVLHPLLIELVFLPLRYMARVLPSASLAPMRLLGVGVLVVVNLLGRLMASNMRTAGGTLAVLAGISALELLQRTTTLKRDRFYLRWVLGRSAAQRYVGSRRAHDAKASALLIDAVSEDFGILVSGVAALVFRLRPTAGAAPPSLGAVAALTAVQFAVEALVDVLPALFVWAMGRDGGVQPVVPSTVPVPSRRGGKLAGRIRANIVAVHNLVVGDMDAPHHALMALTLAAYACVFMHVLTFPFNSFCVVDDGVEWWGVGWHTWGAC